MQENRSFDHYFGALRGVRGFGDPRPVTLDSGKSVWHQTKADGTEVLPFHPDADDLGMQFLEGLPHSWPDGQPGSAAASTTGGCPPRAPPPSRT
ncbi:hypothetical protein SFUMM280S_05767 [Streptomyces fumanus]